MPEKFEPDLNNSDEMPEMPAADAAEKLVKATLGEDAFRRQDKSGDIFGKSGGKEKPNNYRPPVYQQIDRLGEELVQAKRNLTEAGSQKEINFYKEKVERLSKGLEEAKAVRDKIKQEDKEREQRYMSKREESAKEPGLDKERLAA